MSLDLKNMGTAVGILLLSCIETELRLISFFQPPSWISDFRFNPTVFLIVPLNFYPQKHTGRHRNCVSITLDSWVTIGGGNFTTPPRSALQNSVRCPRFNVSTYNFAPTQGSDTISTAIRTLFTWKTLWYRYVGSGATDLPDPEITLL